MGKMGLLYWEVRPTATDYHILLLFFSPSSLNSFHFHLNKSESLTSRVTFCCLHFIWIVFIPRCHSSQLVPQPRFPSLRCPLSYLLSPLIFRPDEPSRVATRYFICLLAPESRELQKDRFTQTADHHTAWFRSPILHRIVVTECDFTFLSASNL